MNNYITFESNHFRYSISEKGENVEFTDKKTGINYIADGSNYCGKLTLCDKSEVNPTAASYKAPYLTVSYPNGFYAKILVTEHENYITFTLDSVSNMDFWALAVTLIEVDIDYSKDSSFIATCMGMTLNTRMREYPGRNSILLGEAYTHIDITGVKSAVIGAPEALLRDIMIEVIDEIPDGDMPKAAHSGPYAIGHRDAERTYTISGIGLTVDNADDYIASMRKFGISQVHLHQGYMYSQGDFTVNEELYPRGIEDFKAMITKLHNNNIQVMLHSYTFFVQSVNAKKGNKYLTPIPHKDLGVFARFTLEDDVSNTSELLPSVESTKEVSTFFGNTIQASNLLWIDDEIIRFSDVTSNGFCVSERGVFGTKPSEHKKGAEIKQLNSYFGYIAPEKNSELFYEIARNNAEFYNECDFDGYYLDAIDGVFVLDGNEFSWYHAVVFINEMFKYQKKPPLFNCCYGPQYPGQWYARTRMGAFDTPARGYRDFTDVHVDFNEKFAERMYLIGELGWWSLYPGNNHLLAWQKKIMYDEDVDYICSKMLATDVCQCWHSSFQNHKTIPLLESYSDKILLYTKLKEERYFPKHIKDQVRKPRSEFELIEDDGGRYAFRPTYTDYNRIESLDDGRNKFTAVNKFKPQAPKIRIEALFTADNSDSGQAEVMLELDENKPLELNKKYNLNDYNTNGKHGLGVWLYGDGKGETIKIRLRSLPHIGYSYGNADYFIKVDFEGWRYYSFYEFQNCEMKHEDWEPEGLDYKVFTDVRKFYAAYSAPVEFNHLDTLEISVNREGDYNLRMKSILSLPSYELTLIDPSVTINGQKIVFKTALKSKTFLEYDPVSGSCVVYDMTGKLLGRPEVVGNAPIMTEGANSVVFDAQNNLPYQGRAAVTLRTSGDVIL